MVRWTLGRSPSNVRVLIGLGADHGVPPETSLADTGLRESALRDPSVTVGARQELTVVANLLRALGNPPGLGLEAGARCHLTSYGVWGFAMASSPSWRSAIDMGVRYLDLTYTFTRIRIRDHGETFHLVLDVPDVPSHLQRFLLEHTSAAIQTLQNELLGSTVPVRDVGYAFPPPASGRQRYAEIFGTPPVFGAAENVVGIPTEILDVPLPQYDALTTALARDRCRRLLDDLDTDTALAGRVRDYLLTRASAPPALERVAADLHMSERTLRRRLAGEGVSFRGLLDGIREQLAEELLVDGGLPVAEVAQRLGYAEVSSFSQAFRRWKGMSPRAYRARQPAGRR
ncbi:AraC family transcriptional regulator [Streptomyces sp. HUAS MG47]|uniref:AraC family transcriptional regulator n=1 Tax=Streptomyces solicamelliae TaxID=3231716 RepID=UPI0038783BE6